VGSNHRPPVPQTEALGLDQPAGTATRGPVTALGRVLIRGRPIVSQENITFSMIYGGETRIRALMACTPCRSFNLSHSWGGRYKAVAGAAPRKKTVITMSECRRPKNRVKSAKKPNKTGHF
jgi:hypothetical protein